jgi:hypothetical protein
MGASSSIEGSGWSARCRIDRHLHDFIVRADARNLAHPHGADDAVFGDPLPSFSDNVT